MGLGKKFDFGFGTCCKFQDIEKSTEKQRELEQERTNFLSELTNLSDPCRFCIELHFKNIHSKLLDGQTGLRLIRSGGTFYYFMHEN